MFLGLHVKCGVVGRPSFWQRLTLAEAMQERPAFSAAKDHLGKLVPVILVDAAGAVLAIAVSCDLGGGERWELRPEGWMRLAAEAQTFLNAETQRRHQAAPMASSKKNENRRGEADGSHEEND